MTTAPTNEMLALADELDFIAENHRSALYSQRKLLRSSANALRLAATPCARDVREACKQIALDHTPAKFDGTLAAHVVGKTIAAAIDALDLSTLNLDAAASAEGGGDLVSYFKRQIEWSRQTFGPALRTKGVIDHIRKELREIEDSPHDLSEWVDVIILAMDGFWRHGGEASNLLPALLAKQQKNMARVWPDWRSMSEDSAIEHDRTKDAAPPLQAPAHSDAVRDMLPTQEYVLRAMVKNYADGNLWDHLDREVCTKAADEIKSLRTALTAPAAKAPAVSEADVDETYRIDHDGFEGVKIGTYTTLEGKRGVVLQQVGTRVVHVYGEKWLKPIQSAAQGGWTKSDGGVEGHADPSSGRSSRASHFSRELEEAGIKPGPSDPPSQEASAPPNAGGR